jgi:hypothetical protein
MSQGGGFSTGAAGTGDPQADAFRQAGFEQELCRLFDLNEIGRPLERRRTSR